MNTDFHFTKHIIILLQASFPSFHCRLQIYEEISCCEYYIRCLLLYIVTSHTFLIDKHVGLHSSQNASYTGALCDLHVRLTAKPRICMMCFIFHTDVKTSLPAMLHPHLLIKRQKGLNFYTQVEHFSLCDSSDDISISGIQASQTY